jgi:hypothetical protein
MQLLLHLRRDPLDNGEMAPVRSDICAQEQIRAGHQGLDGWDIWERPQRDEACWPTRAVIQFLDLEGSAWIESPGEVGRSRGHGAAGGFPTPQWGGRGGHGEAGIAALRR